jgi:hypothetical protein
LGLFTVDSWREFQRHGARLMGFNENKRTAAAGLQLGDRILCYLSKVSAFVGVLEVTGTSYMERVPLWTDGLFPVRLPVRVAVEVPLFKSIPIRQLRGRLTFMPADSNAHTWTAHIRSSPRRWSLADGKTVYDALMLRSGEPASDERPASSTRDATRAELPTVRGRRFKTGTRVGRVSSRTLYILQNEDASSLGSYDSALSFNKVTGYSVNVPIAQTCLPTAVCLKACYFASGAPTWPNALRHQTRVMESIKTDPLRFAQRIAMEYDREGLTFLRWNGGGDLFEESVEAINHLGRERPDIRLWVVTRHPEMAAKIEDRPNVFIHFSLDSASLPRREQFLRLRPLSSRFFFSYQCAPGEVPERHHLEAVSVVFFHDYEPTCDLSRFREGIVCPLNGRAEIADTCARCRRCFNGTAVTDSRQQSAHRLPGT